MSTPLSLTATPETKYARKGDIHLAYQTLGEGPPDVVNVTAGPSSHIEYLWEEPTVARAIRRLASYGRLILFDPRGVGLSDPVAPKEIPSMEQQVEDLAAILDTVGSQRAVLVGYVAGAATAMVFAALHPERVESLILMMPYARMQLDDDYPIGIPGEVLDGIVQQTIEGWGTAQGIELIAPSMAGDPLFRAWWAQIERLGASPGTAGALVNMWFHVDVRSILPTIRVPTLVFGRKDQPLMTAAMARYVADHIDGARYVELAGADVHAFLGDTEPLFRAIDDFLDTELHTSDSDRSLGTVVFTDMVQSTNRAAEIGDGRWHDLLESHNRLVRRQLERFGGRLIDTAGDGALSLFDGPARAIACAQAIRDGVRALGIEIRAGLHTGELEHRQDGGIDGIAVHIGARIASLASPNEILVSRTIKDLVAGSRIRLESRGVHQLKGVPDPWEIFAVAG
ncbi:MAG: adenylate/guanylate cyclase domain-containing protein [Chloroflexi bacterium]|nr:MAG: adenylate/guanylate cyclase domain-containing protein [Chloroflexota bacterium]